MRNEEIITRLNNIKRRAKSQKRDQVITIVITPQGFAKVYESVNAGFTKPQKVTNRQVSM